jgi:hypothetical protein
VVRSKEFGRLSGWLSWLLGKEVWRWKHISRADGRPYLWRFTLMRLPFVCIYFHSFAGSDDVCQHDHPWPFVSFVLRGGYWEWVRAELAAPRDLRCAGDFIELPDGRISMRVWRRPGSVLFRPAIFLHRIEPVVGKPCWSLVITGRRVREWGFLTVFGWMHWKNYDYAVHCPE